MLERTTALHRATVNQGKAINLGTVDGVPTTNSRIPGPETDTSTLNPNSAQNQQPTNPHLRSRVLKQLGVNCRWSSVVVDEQPDARNLAHAGAYLDRDPAVLYAGDRAPDAPGLVPINGKSTSTSLFTLFSLSHHTVLVFGGNASLLTELRHMLCGALRSLVKLVRILDGSLKEAEDQEGGADVALVDRDGHAHDAYSPVTQGFPIIVVRPDGVVGAIVESRAGLKRYLDGVFVQSP